MSNMIHCKSCDQEIAKSAKTCPHCGAKNKKPIFKKWWFWVIIAVIAIGVIAGGASGGDSGDGGSETPGGTSSGGRDSAFTGECGIAATAEMGVSVLGDPTVSVSVKNTTDKDINAIQFYVVYYNVYGEEVNSFLLDDKIGTDNTIAARKSDTRTWTFYDDSVKTVKLYVYSVYFSDGTEWGDREATTSVILKNAVEITVEGKSE